LKPYHLRQIAIARECIRKLTKLWTLLEAQNDILTAILDQYQLAVPDLTPPLSSDTIVFPENMKPHGGSKLSLDHILLPKPPMHRANQSSGTTSCRRDSFFSANAMSSQNEHDGDGALSSPAGSGNRELPMAEIYRALGVSTFEPFPILFIDNADLLAAVCSDESVETFQANGQ
jgi:hypothetical protein